MSGEKEENVGVAAVDELTEHMMEDVPGAGSETKAEDADLASQALAETETEAVAEKPEDKPAEKPAESEAEGSEKPDAEKPKVKPEGGQAADAEAEAVAKVGKQKPEDQAGEADDRDAENKGVVRDLQGERQRRRDAEDTVKQAQLAQARAEAKLEAYQEMARKPDAEQPTEPQTRNEILDAIRERDGLTGSDVLNLDQQAEYNEQCDRMQERGRQRSFEQARDKFVKTNRSSVDAAMVKFSPEAVGKGRSFTVVTRAAANLLTDSDKEKVQASENIGESLYSTSLERLTEAGLLPAEKTATQEVKDKNKNEATDKPKGTGERQPQTAPEHVPDQKTILSHEEALTQELFAGPEVIKPEDLD